MGSRYSQYLWRFQSDGLPIMREFFLIVLVFAVSGCKAGGIDTGSLESSEKALHERQRKELVAYMSLETMFPDRQVRTLAQAAGKGKLQEMDELAAHGVDVNSVGTNGATLLFWALRSANFDGFEKLNVHVRV